MKVDIFVLDDARWGLGFLVRTGSAEFSQAMLVRWEARSGGGFSHGLQLTGAVGIVRRLPQAGSGDVRWSRWLRRGSRWSSPSRRLCSPMMAWSTPDSRAVQPDDGAGTLG